jgi:RNA polymerase sigma factor (sigma-70 family)
MEDKLLVLRCKRGSSDALRRIYEKYKRDLLILAVALSNDASAAEDVVHDVFVRFVQTLEKFQLTGSLKGYLATCVANCARNTNKAKHRQNVGLDEAQAVSLDPKNPHQSVVCNEELQQLSLAVGELPYEQREVIMLHLQCGLSFRGIAKLGDVSVNTVKSRYRYGLDKLRTFFGETEK